MRRAVAVVAAASALRCHGPPAVPATGHVGVPTIGWIGSSDFVEGQAEIALASTRETLLVVATGSATAHVTIRRTPLSKRAVPLRALPRRDIDSRPFDPPSPPDKPPSTTKTFELHDRKLKTWTKVQGHLVFVGAHFAYYDEIGGEPSFSSEEWARLDARATVGFRRVVSAFGPPTDVDQDGRVTVFVSTTARAVQPDGQAFTALCHLLGSCAPRGDVITIWAPSAKPAGDAPRPFLVDTFYPRAILHETAHLVQHAASQPPQELHAAEFLVEGQAQLARVIGAVPSDDLLDTVCTELAGDRPTFAAHPYGMSLLLPAFLHEWRGSRIHRGLAVAMNEGPLALERATGQPTPLLVALAFARLADPAGGALLGQREGVLPWARLRACTPVVDAVAGLAEVTVVWTGTGIVRVPPLSGSSVTITSTADDTYVVASSAE